MPAPTADTDMLAPLPAKLASLAVMVLVLFTVEPWRTASLMLRMFGWMMFAFGRGVLPFVIRDKRSPVSEIQVIQTTTKAIDSLSREPNANCQNPP